VATTALSAKLDSARERTSAAEVGRCAKARSQDWPDDSSAVEGESLDKETDGATLMSDEYPVSRTK
jgi:hypothetical protein